MKLSQSPLDNHCDNYKEYNGWERLSKHFVFHEAGIYSSNFVVTRIQKLINNIIVQEASKINAFEVKLSTLQNKKHWEESGRHAGYGNETFTLKTKKNTYYLAPTAEEMATLLIKHSNVQNISRLPLLIYQISEKYRNEIRPRNGLARTRCFRMLDLYSFTYNSHSSREIYQKIMRLFIRILHKCGIKNMIILATNDTGEIGGSFSHEIFCKSIYGDTKMNLLPAYLNDQMTLQELDSYEYQKSTKEIHYTEIGHLFDLETIYSKKEAMNSFSIDNKGRKLPHYMGCYGIGTSRLLQLIFSSMKRLPWILNPCYIYIIQDRSCKNFDIYNALCEKYGHDKIWLDDRKSISTGVKESNGIGIKLRLIFRYDNNMDFYEDEHKKNFISKKDAIEYICDRVNILNRGYRNG